MVIYSTSGFLFFFLIPNSVANHANVHLKLPTEIRLGQELKFYCETSSVISASKSRQWRGGANNKLLCYDGTTVDPTKYKEKMINQTNFELIVEEASENDLECSYACRVGFDIDQKFLEVNDNNFVQLPDITITKVDYQLQNGQYRLTLVLFKVFPKPVCRLKNQGTILPETNATKSVVLNNVTYTLESSESIIPCGKKLEIECKVGNERYLVPARNIITCSPKTSKDSTTSLETIVGVCVACISFVGLAVLWTLYKRKQKRNGEYKKAVNKDEGINHTM